MSANSSTVGTSRERSAWVDQARGWAILLIVLGHVERGLEGAELLPSGGLFQALDRYIYSFHFHCFFVLSGLFAQRATGQPAARFLAGKLRTVVYPWFLWAALQTAVQVLLSRHTNSNLGWGALLRIPYDPPMQFWFMRALFLIALTHYACSRLGISGVRYLVLSTALFVGWYGDLFVALSALGDVLKLSIYFAVGVAVAPSLLEGSGRSTARWEAVLISLLLVPLFTLGEAKPNPFVGLIVALAGASGLIALSRWLTRFRSVDAISFIGARSLEIFVAHTLFSAATRIGLLKVFHIENPLTHVALGWTAGVLGPLALAVASERWHFEFLFRLRKPRRAKAV